MTTFFFSLAPVSVDFSSLSFSNFQVKEKKKKAVYFFHYYIQISSELGPGTFQTKGSFLTNVLKCVTLILCNAVFQLSTFHTALFRTRALVLQQLSEDKPVQCFPPHPLPVLCRHEQLLCVINPGSVLLQEHWGSLQHCSLGQPWYILHWSRIQDFWNNRGIRGITVQMNIFWRLKDFWFSLHQLWASCVRKATHRPRAGEIRKLSEL